MAAHLFSTIAEATLRLSEKVRIQAISAAILAVMMIAGSRWGLAGAAAGMAIGSLAYFVLYLRLTARIIQYPAAKLVAWFVPGLSCGGICAAYAAGVPLLYGGNSVFVLFVQIAGCGLCAVAYYAVIHRDLFMSLLRFAGLRRA
jgi:hypothetical protein